MIAGGDGGGAGTAFPDPPKGSPGEIGAIARSFHDAAAQLDQCEHGLKGASAGLAGDWQGYAANAYQASSSGLAVLARAAAQTALAELRARGASDAEQLDRVLGWVRTTRVATADQ